MEIFAEIQKHLAQNEPAALCIIIRAEGSSPGKQGAKMAVFADGTAAGTVGGGAAELAAKNQAQTVLNTGCACDCVYELTSAADMVCGGRVTVRILRLTKEDAPTVRQLARSEGGSLLLTKNGSLRIISGEEAAEDGDYREKIEEKIRVLIFGGGHVGTALTPLLHGLDFSVTVFDDRPEIAEPSRFPQAERVVCGDFGNLSADVSVRPTDFAVVLTPNHRSDREVLLQLLQTDAAYLGVIGSHGKAEATNAFLRENGFKEAQIGRIHSPIGLSIGAKTPQEIAVSIAAELIACRRAIRP